MDRPSNISANSSFEDEVNYQFAKARNATSHSGNVCQLIGLLMVAASPFALVMGGKNFMVKSKRLSQLFCC